MSAPPDTEFSSDGKPHETISRPTVRDREISENNFGAGYYDSSEVYLQTQRFKRTLNANASVGQAIHRLALGEALLQLARQGWKVQDEDEKTYDIPKLAKAGDRAEYQDMAEKAREEGHRHREQELIYGRLVFENLPDYVQQAAIVDLSTLEERFDPPEMRITKFFHEATRSKGGRLMDNVFGRVKKLISPGGGQPTKQASQRSFFGRNGGGMS